MNYFKTLGQILLFITLALVSSDVAAQKIKKVEQGMFNFDLPRMSKKLDGYNSYHVIAEVSNDRSYRRRIFEDRISLDPIPRADANTDPDFIVYVKELPIYFREPERKSRKKKVDEREVTYYYYKGSYLGKASVKVETKDGNVVYNEMIEVTDFIKGGEMRSSSEAKDDYLERKVGWREDSAEKIAAEITSRLKSEYTNESKSLVFYSTKVSGKKADYSDFDVALEEQLNVFLDYQTNNSVTDAMAEVLEKNKEKWLTILNESDVNNKKARINKKVTAAAKYHLGFTYYLLGDYKNANTMYRQSAQLEKFIVHNAPTWAEMVDQTEIRYENWQDELD